MFGLMLGCALIAVMVVAVLAGGLTWLAACLVAFKTPWINALFTGIVGIVSGIGGWLMLPVITVIVSGAFQESVIRRVEQAYYPDTVRREDIRFWPDFWHDIKFTLWALLLNLLILPLYLIFIGVIAALLINSYLLGREFFESAAGYHLGKPAAKALGKKHKTVIYLNGLIITVMTLVPLLNLFVPIIAIAWMVHVYHKLQPSLT